MLLEEGRAVGNKELREYLEVKGYADAADWVYSQAISRATSRPTAARSRWRRSDRSTDGDDAGLGRVALTRRRPTGRARGFGSTTSSPFPAGWVRPLAAGPRRWTSGSPMRALSSLTAAFPERWPTCTPLRADPPVPRRQRPDGPARPQPDLVRLGYPPAIIYKRDRAALPQRTPPGRRRRCGAWASSSPEPSSTTSTASSFRQSPDPPALSRWLLSPETINARAAHGRQPRPAPGRAGRGREWRSSRNWVEEYLETRYQRRGS